MNKSNESVDVDEISLEGIVKFLWKIRRVVLVLIIVLLLLVIIAKYRTSLDEYRTSLDEYRTLIAEYRNRSDAENDDFSSANLNRIDSGIYRLRVEVFGDFAATRRAETPIDLDRDLNIIVQRQNGLLSLSITNEHEGIIVQDVEIRGSLRNRETYDFHQISIVDKQANLGYNEVSRGIPISIFTTNNYAQLELENWRWLTDIEEFREHFRLHLIDVTFKTINEHGQADELIRLRYTTSTDFYEIISRENLSVSDEYHEGYEDNEYENDLEDEDTANLSQERNHDWTSPVEPLPEPVGAIYPEYTPPLSLEETVPPEANDDSNDDDSNEAGLVPATPETPDSSEGVRLTLPQTGAIVGLIILGVSILLTLEQAIASRKRAEKISPEDYLNQKYEKEYNEAFGDKRIRKISESSNSPNGPKYSTYTRTIRF